MTPQSLLYTPAELLQRRALPIQRVAIRPMPPRLLTAVMLAIGTAWTALQKLAG